MFSGRFGLCFPQRDNGIRSIRRVMGRQVPILTWEILVNEEELHCLARTLTRDPLKAPASTDACRR